MLSEVASSQAEGQNKKLLDQRLGSSVKGVSQSPWQELESDFHET